MPVNELKVFSDRDAIYLAGFIDGEGCIGIYERSAENSGPGTKCPVIFPQLSIANTNLEVLRYIERTFGGHVSKARNVGLQKDGKPRQMQYRWAAGPRVTTHILSRVLPFLIVKRQQAELALEYHESIRKFIHRSHPFHLGKPPLTPEEIERRRGFVVHMKSLKRVQSADA